MDRSSDPHSVSSLSPIWKFNVQECEGDQERQWSDCVMADMNVCSLGGIDPQYRTAWRSGIRSYSIQLLQGKETVKWKLH